MNNIAWYGILQLKALISFHLTDWREKIESRSVFSVFGVTCFCRGFCHRFFPWLKELKVAVTKIREVWCRFAWLLMKCMFRNGFSHLHSLITLGSCTVNVPVHIQCLNLHPTDCSTWNTTCLWFYFCVYWQQQLWVIIGLIHRTQCLLNYVITLPDISY